MNSNVLNCGTTELKQFYSYASLVLCLLLHIFFGYFLADALAVHTSYEDKI